MGIIISRFRKKKTTSEILEKLEIKIKGIERDGRFTEQRHKRIIGYMMAYSIGLYILFAVLYYYMYIGKSQYWIHTLTYMAPLLVLPMFVILLRSAISWYYNWSLKKNELKLNLMRHEKKKILEEVMNTETYKVAKEILDKYGVPDQQSKALRPFVPTTNTPGNSPTPPLLTTPGQLKQRQLAIQSTPVKVNNLNIMPLSPTSPMYKSRSLQLPRPILSNERSALDKVVDFLMKDGPNCRMALICKECCSHNGMAMIEEFDYVSYVCAYCGTMNPSRKQRPAAPSLRTLPALNMSRPDEDSPSISSCSDSEDERRPLPIQDKTDCDADPAPPQVEEAPKSAADKKED